MSSAQDYVLLLNFCYDNSAKNIIIFLVKEEDFNMYLRLIKSYFPSFLLESTDKFYLTVLHKIYNK